MPALRRRLGAFAALALMTTSLAMLGQAMNSPASAAELLKDGSFEAGSSGDSPAWTETDSVFGSPLCTLGGCGGGGGTVGPRTGDVWAWFGGTGNAGHTASLSQQVVIPRGDTTLSYYYYNGNAATPADATLQVKVDGNVVKTHTEAAADEPGYALVTVNLKAYSNGLAHTLSFEYTGGAAGDVSTNMSVDDISLNSLFDCVALQASVDAASAALATADKKLKKAKKALKKAKKADKPEKKIKKLKKKVKKAKKAKKSAQTSLATAQANAAPCAARTAPRPSPAPQAPVSGTDKPAGGASGGRLS